MFLATTPPGGGRPCQAQACQPSAALLPAPLALLPAPEPGPCLACICRSFSTTSSVLAISRFCGKRGTAQAGGPGPGWVAGAAPGGPAARRAHRSLRRCPAAPAGPLPGHLQGLDLQDHLVCRRVAALQLAPPAAAVHRRRRRRGGGGAGRVRGSTATRLCTLSGLSSSSPSALTLARSPSSSRLRVCTWGEAKAAEAPSGVGHTRWARCGHGSRRPLALPAPPRPAAAPPAHLAPQHVGVGNAAPQPVQVVLQGGHLEAGAV